MSKITNTGQRTFNNFKARSSVRYAEDISGINTYGQWVSFKAGDLIPGNAITAWIPASMSPGETITIAASIPLLYEALPGKIYVKLEVAHTNESGNDTAAVMNYSPKAFMQY